MIELLPTALPRSVLRERLRDGALGSDLVRISTAAAAIHAAEEIRRQLLGSAVPVRPGGEAA